MSVDLVVYLRRSMMPSPAAWQEAILQAGFPVEIDTNFDPDTFAGFLPCTISGAHSGFEYFASSITEQDRKSLGAPAGTDFSVTLVTHSDLTECASSAAAAASLAARTGGTLFDPQSGESFSAESALAWANVQIEAAQREQLEEPVHPQAVPPVVRWGKRLLTTCLAVLGIGAAIVKMLFPQMLGKGLNPATLWLLRAVRNGGGGRESGRSNLAAHIGASLRSGKMGASAPILSNFAGRPRSAIRHGVLERGSSAGADERIEPARRDAEVWLGLAHAEEDLGACRTAWLPAEQGQAEAEARAVPADHPPASGGGPPGSQEAAAYGQADLRVREDGYRRL